MANLEITVELVIFVAAAAGLLASMVAARVSPRLLRGTAALVRAWLVMVLVGLGAWAGGVALGEDTIVRILWFVMATFALGGTVEAPELRRTIRWRGELAGIVVAALLAAGAAVLWKAGGTPAKVIIGALFLTSANLLHARNLERGTALRREALVRRMSHALRTPAAAIRALADALGAGAVEDPAERARFVALISAEADRLATGTTRLLRLARGEDAPRPARVRLDLTEWAHATAARWRALLPDLALAAPTTLPASVDPELLDEAVDALLDNALRYGRPPVALAVAVVGDRVELAVSDAGAGLDVQARARLARLLDQPDALPDDGEGARGFGLGQWAAAQVARAHGGELRLAGPSRFVLSLPANP